MMRKFVVVVIGSSVMALCGMGVAVADSLALYSEAQARQGHATYSQSCAGCHGADLLSGAAPALKGEGFQGMAKAQSLTVASLLRVVSQTMPKESPGSLSGEQYAAIIAYILKQNGYPAGAAPLTAGDAGLALSLAQPTAATPPSNDHGVSAAPTAMAESVQTAPVTANVTVTDAMLKNTAADKDNWLLFGRTYENQRFSPLTQINVKTVKKLVPVSIIQTGISNSFEASPIVVNGVMYISTPYDHVQAYDAVTGAVLWSYNPKLGYSNQCCGPVSRGVAVAYGKVFVAQLDGIVVALDAKTGKVVWKSDPAKTLPTDPAFYSFTLAPQVYDGMVVVGSSGAEYPTRGFVQAYDANTGALIWRFRTIPGSGEPGHETWAGESWKYGGGSMWDTPALDQKTGLLVFGVGNPNPDANGDLRPGDNAYTDSVVAVNAKDGKLAWWHQVVPHDMWDYDQCAPVVFFDADDGHGKRVPAVGEAGKEGNLYILDRRNGTLLRKSDPFVLQSANIFKPQNNEPVYPSPAGGNTWSAPAFSPLTHDFYVPGANMAWSYYQDKDAKPYTPGIPVAGQFIGGRMHIISGVDKNIDTIPVSGTFSAINVDTGRIAWQYKSEYPMIGGALATAGNLVFTGEQNGQFDAFDARTGHKLWHFNLGVGVTAPPVTYRVNGVQYVAVAAGGAGANGYERMLQLKGRPQFGDVIAIFALPGK
jgi:alcohol dehydrogenase (cytochrome c)